MKRQWTDFQSILAAWRERDAIGTAKLIWVTSNGKTVSGISQGIDNHGILHIRDNQGCVHEVISGDVNLVK